MKGKIKTIDIQAKEWFDKTYGNSYFAAIISINYGLKNERTYKMPFQYGYGDHYRDMAFKLLQENGEVKNQERNLSYWRYYDDNKIIARHSKKENCLQRELKNI